MKKLNFLFIFLIIIVAGIQAHASSEMYLGPTIGATTMSDADGSLNRNTQTSYGADGYYIFDHFAAGLSYKYFGNFSDGNPSVNISQVNNWISAEGKYLFNFHDLHPYLSLGVGSVLQTITTTVVGTSSEATGVYFSRDVGLGMMGRFGSETSLGYNVGARYFQYSNTNGFDYIVSIGFFPDFSK